MSIRILLADDHPIVRHGVRALLEKEGFKVVGEASDGQEVLRLAQTLFPDVAVLDLAMPNLNGIDTCRQLTRDVPKTKSILLTMHADDHYVLEALQAGFKGYVLKNKAPEDLVNAVREVARGGVYMSADVSLTVTQAYLNQTDLAASPLSNRERQVLQLIAEGKTTKEVAAILNVSVKTAETHRTRIMEKLDIHGTAGLVRYAIRKGLTQP